MYCTVLSLTQKRLPVCISKRMLINTSTRIDDIDFGQGKSDNIPKHEAKPSLIQAAFRDLVFEYRH